MTRPPVWWSVLALALLFGGASLLNLGSLYDPLDPFVRTARFVLIGSGLFMLLPFLPSGVLRFKPTVLSATLIGFWVLFGLVCVVSSFVTDGDLQSFGGALWILVGIPLVFFVGLPGILGQGAEQLVIFALFVSHAVYIVVSFCLYPELRFEYKGIFGHPNAFGVTAAVLALCCLTWIVERVEAGNFARKAKVFLFAVWSASCFLVLVSGSRTSLVAVLITTGAAFLICARHMTRRRLLSTVAASVLLLGLATVFVPELGVAQQIWGKHTEQIMKGDVFSKRDEIWEKTLDDMRLWGNGSTYFSESVGISSHNSIMHIIGENGPVAALLMILFAGIAAAIALRQAFIRRRRKVFDALPALIATCFWTMSAGEAMFGSLGTGITLAYLLSVGIAINGAALAPGGRASGR